MRLLNSTTLALHEFFDTQVPPYAILSHRWEDEEVTFKDVMHRRNLEAKGWSKVEKFCEFAAREGHQWVWIDTCCIDKRSSAELSEAINSMFRWYEDATGCFVYLCDVECEDGDIVSMEERASWNLRGTVDVFWMGNDEDLTASAVDVYTSGLREGLAKEFRASKWFTRGWTLQELLAPRVLRFIDKDWKGVFGSKISLNKIVSEITGIPNAGFRTAKNMRFVSIAARMCWASRRVCTRAEDVAYSLLGIFDVNMPLLYGEGAYKAFLRLQLEIMKESDDESIFAWYPGYLPAPQRGEIKGGLLAGSPSHFSQPILSKVQNHRLDSRIRRVPYTMTNKGLAIKAMLLPDGDYDINVPDKYFKMALNCYLSKEKQPLAIRLVRTGQYSFERILGPEFESIREWDQSLFDEADRGSFRTHQLDEENRIYVSQSRYPELLSRSMELLSYTRPEIVVTEEVQSLPCHEDEAGTGHVDFSSNHEYIMSTIPKTADQDINTTNLIPDSSEQ
jgi:Heterokaryon incompatibility protein (HET)